MPKQMALQKLLSSTNFLILNLGNLYIESKLGAGHQADGTSNRMAKQGLQAKKKELNTSEK